MQTLYLLTESVNIKKETIILQKQSVSQNVMIIIIYYLHVSTQYELLSSYRKLL